MTRSPLALPDLHRLPRFTFAGRGCRDSRREPRRRPDLAMPRRGVPTAPPAAVLVVALADAPGPSAARREPTSALSSTGPGPAADPPPAGVLHG